LSWAVDLAVGLVKLAWELRPTKPTWRWGHTFSDPETTICENCDRVLPFRTQVTSPICPGPTKERAALIKARRAARK